MSDPISKARRVLEEHLHFFAGQSATDFVEAIEALKACEQQAPHTGMVPVPEAVVTFLLGESALDGMHFGDRPEPLPGSNIRPAFWWRKHLRAALKAAKETGNEDQPEVR
ncbi:MAG: hypothetical protein Q8K97_07545 [Pseudohongiella sp.]|nr:hypothetical protein [Pseudohongiella sp.]